MLEKLASSMGRNDEQPNIDLAIHLVETKDQQGILEIVNGLQNKQQPIANDCIKVLYEIEDRNPTLLAQYVGDILNQLNSKNNRMAWGAMTALAKIAALKPKEIIQNIELVIKAYENGSVITIDNSISVFAEIVKALPNETAQVYELIIKHLRTCRPKEVGQHAERAFICITKQNSEPFKQVLINRKADLTEPQSKRVDKLLKKIEAL